MTAYEVRLSYILHAHQSHHHFTHEILTETLPYGNYQGGIIIHRIVTGDRPPRPKNARWLKVQTWNMIVACWSMNLELRWDIRTVYDQFLVSSFQEITEVERGNQRNFQTATYAEDVIPCS